MNLVKLHYSLEDLYAQLLVLLECMVMPIRENVLDVIITVNVVLDQKTINVVDVVLDISYIKELVLIHVQMVIMVTKLIINVLIVMEIV